ncbi:S46 family peptidase [Pseudoxanthomonas winnipegensis]|uniref:Dipeptidyl-peptidase n=2 Tax=Pseudoxanthomonas winnipegensis TaxID=2480810 RepID=A0A4Q8LS38_9GAMM|nr:S46 family peptidase [Pseudoxanthomonas winnipegensis]RZZ89929.1 S46 family peptidase [Pseudoxanthomonas winnipegensis]TAA33535.1 S46 family peptidase [Pseudoxanthomonas winnipegensis]TAA43303.1 S46 family peptidase [Pseudoxanthomonas winnipegensis]TBV78775.1 S46 family peptidase [Pseudoxanthomonas winnipegensis]
MHMTRTLPLAASLALLLSSTARADEGMWLPTQLPSLAEPLREAGFRGDPAALADVTQAPLSAVVKVGGGTGSFVSGDGLLVTNHHVAYGVIQYSTKAGANLIDDGFVAQARGEELPANPDFRVLVTTAFDKVTDQVLADAKGKTGRAYYDAVDAASKRLVAACEAAGNVRCSVATMDYGADFYRVTQLELRDIRLVYAPPRAIGNYGDEIDNFMWPRHAGDFTFLRAYVGKDGKPADYSADNVPYQPPAFLKMAVEGPKEGDFAMLAGYPGITYRNRTAAEFEAQVGHVLPARVAVFDALIALIAQIEQAGKANAEARTRYASQLQSLKNNRKRAAGELEGLQRSDAARLRAADEAGMLAATRGAQKQQIDQLQQLLAQGQALGDRDLLLGLVAGQTQLLRSALTLERLRLESAKPDAQRETGYQQRDQALIEGQLKQVQRRYDATTEKALLTVLLGRYQQLPEAQRVPAFDAAFGRTPAELAKALDALYGATTLGTESERLSRFAAARQGQPLADDALIALAAKLVPAQLELENARKTREGDLLRLRPAYMQALAAWRAKQGRASYPDANSTLRVSFGQVTPLAPRDAVAYAPLTTVAGIVEKNTGTVPFDAPKPLLEAIAKGDFGSTADPVLKTQTVDFLTNLDTTGGNSGSPVLNAKGELMGLNFDSNWEAVSASWWYDPRYKRAIHVDARYIRWLLAKVYPAPALLREMGVPAQ